MGRFLILLIPILAKSILIAPVAVVKALKVYQKEPIVKFMFTLLASKIREVLTKIMNEGSWLTSWKVDVFDENRRHSVVEEPHLVLGLDLKSTSPLSLLHQVVVDRVDVFAELVESLKESNFIFWRPVHSLGSRLALWSHDCFWLLLFLVAHF